IIRGSGWSGYVKKVLSARQRPEKERDLTDVKALELAGHLSRYASLREMDGELNVVPMIDPEKWKTLADATSDGDKVIALDASSDGDAKTAPTGDPQKWKTLAEAISGKVERVHVVDRGPPGANSITLSGVEHLVDKDAKITIDGKEAKLEDVKKGMTVTLLLGKDNPALRSLNRIIEAYARGDAKA